MCSLAGLFSPRHQFIIDRLLKRGLRRAPLNLCNSISLRAPNQDSDTHSKTLSDSMSGLSVWAVGNMKTVTNRE